MKSITKKQLRAIHIEAMKSCVCVSSSPARDRCTVGGWIRCTGTQEACRRLEQMAMKPTKKTKPFLDVQNPIPCATCGIDLNADGQWLRCREHYVATINRLRSELKSSHDTLCAKPGTCACSERKRAEAYKAAAEAYGSFFKGPGAAFELLKRARALEPESGGDND